MPATLSCVAHASSRTSAMLVALAVIGFALPTASSFAASPQSSLCRAYADDYAHRYSAGGAMGGIVRGAARGRPSAMRGLQRRWLHSHAYENCMNGQWP
jgi:hypothetical protein